MMDKRSNAIRVKNNDTISNFPKPCISFSKKQLFSTLILCAVSITFAYSLSPLFDPVLQLGEIMKLSSEEDVLVIEHVSTPGINISQHENSIAQMLYQNRIGKVTIVTIAHSYKKKTVQSWISSLTNNTFRKFVVLCYDQRLLNFLKSEGHEKNVAIIPFEWLSNSGKIYTKESITVNLKILKAKSNIWYNLIRLGHSFVYSEPDVVWRSKSVLEHLEYQYFYSNADVLFSQDPVSRVLYYNTGFFYARPTPFVRSLFSRIIAEQTKNIKLKTDQSALNNILQASHFNDSRVGRLDMLLYANDLVHFKNKLNRNTIIDPLVTFKSQSVWRLSRKLQVATDRKLEYENEKNSKIDEIMITNKIIDFSTIITIANYGFNEFVHNWILSLKKNNFNKFVVFCYDQALVNNLIQKGYQNNTVLIPSNWLDSNLSLDLSNWGRDSYKNLVRSKTNIWYHLLMQGHSFVFSDPDIVWLSKHVIDHLKFQYDHSNADILFSQDLQKRTPYCNTGFFMATPTRFVQDLFGNMLRLQHLPDKKDLYEQYILRDMVAASKFNDTRLDTLDLLLYPNGRVHFFDNLNKKMSISPLVVHPNYIMSGRAKISKLISKKYWYL